MYSILTGIYSIHNSDDDNMCIGRYWVASGIEQRLSKAHMPCGQSDFTILTLQGYILVRVSVQNSKESKLCKSNLCFLHYQAGPEFLPVKSALTGTDKLVPAMIMNSSQLPKQ